MDLINDSKIKTKNVVFIILPIHKSLKVEIVPYKYYLYDFSHKEHFLKLSLHYHSI